MIFIITDSKKTKVKVLEPKQILHRSGINATYYLLGFSNVNDVQPCLKAFRPERIVREFPYHVYNRGSKHSTDINIVRSFDDEPDTDELLASFRTLVDAVTFKILIEIAYL